MTFETLINYNTDNWEPGLMTIFLPDNCDTGQHSQFLRCLLSLSIAPSPPPPSSPPSLLSSSWRRQTPGSTCLPSSTTARSRGRKPKPLWQPGRRNLGRCIDHFVGYSNQVTIERPKSKDNLNFIHIKYNLDWPTWWPILIASNQIWFNQLGINLTWSIPYTGPYPSNIA